MKIIDMTQHCGICEKCRTTVKFKLPPKYLCPTGKVAFFTGKKSRTKHSGGLLN